MVETLVPLIAALALIVVVPGPNTVAVVAASVRRRRAGLFTALGVSTGDAAWASASLAGLGALLEHARPVFLTVRWLGACYLVFLAVGLWRQGGSSDAPNADSRRKHPFLNGVLVDLANPKAAVFFTSLYASLVPEGLDVWSTGTILATTIVIIYGWYCALAMMLSRPPAQRVYRRAGRTVNRCAAGAMGVLGLRLALSD